MEHRPTRYTPPLVFGILELPFGACVGFLQIAVPYWLAQAGVPLAEIAAVSAVGFVPHAWKILWVPLMDIGRVRKWWYAASTLAAAGLIAATSLFADPAQHLATYGLLLAASQAGGATLSSAVDSLMATTADPTKQGKAAGFKMAGNVGGTAVLGVLPIRLASTFSPQTSGLTMAAIMTACGFFIFFVDEPKREALRGGAEAWAGVSAGVRAFLHDIWSTVRRREGWTALVICLAPVGCGALTNLFSAMAGDYHASEATVEVVNGLGGGIFAAAGSICGGVLADRMNRRVAYCLAGGATALTALAMALSPMTPATYAWGAMVYFFMSGMAFAAFAGMVLEIVSHSLAVSTKYALFVAASNQAISYVTYLDGRASHFAGPRGPLWFDGLFTVFGIGVAGVMFWLLSKRPADSAREAAA